MKSEVDDVVRRYRLAAFGQVPATLGAALFPGRPSWPPLDSVLRALRTLFSGSDSDEFFRALLADRPTAQEWRSLSPPQAQPGEAFRALVVVLSKLLPADARGPELEERIASVLRGAARSDEIVRQLAAQLRGPC